MREIASLTGRAAALAKSEREDDIASIFEPLRPETLADVFRRYREDRRRICEIAGLFADENAALVRYFVEANGGEARTSSPQRLFELAPTIKALDAAYWSQALALTDVLESMPAKRREEWNQTVRDHATPPFDEATVLATVHDLLAMRPQYFAERVDGLFRALSDEHLTNRPEGFGKRMIIQRMHDGWSTNHDRVRYIHDLRCVIAKFMGREEPQHYVTYHALEYARRHRCGEWTVVDAGVLRLRTYKNGNAHLEIHPDMAWRLNAILAMLHPTAIPAEHRRRPRKAPPKDFVRYERPLPSAVLGILVHARPVKSGDRTDVHLEIDANKSPAYAETCAVLEAIGGVRTEWDCSFSFDYPAGPIIAEIAATGVIPDERAHQFYPTPADMARKVVDAAAIEGHHTVLEPSAGQGALAALLPKHATLVEVADLHCQILRAKGFANVICGDFLAWSPGRRFHRIVMNSPFADGQWVRHLEHAAELVAAHGRIVAVLPASARERKGLLPGFACTWSAPEPFPGTSIEVVILVADRQ